MTDEYSIAAYAKINLFLKICGKLPNGYHKLITLMQEVSLHDDVFIEFDSDRACAIEVVCGELKDTAPEKNLCYKAAAEFLKYLEKKYERMGKASLFPYIKISIIKNVPSEAGLGGGSSDAASVLSAMQDWFGEPFSERELVTIALRIGADVPFFLFGGTCICSGVGEDVRAGGSLKDLKLLIVKPDFGVPTPQCFADVDKTGGAVGAPSTSEFNMLSDKICNNEIELSSLKDLMVINKYLINDLERPAGEIVPQIKKIKAKLLEGGAKFSAMSGSGSAVFGIFENDEDIERARRLFDGQEFSNCKLYDAVTL